VQDEADRVQVSIRSFDGSVYDHEGRFVGIRQREATTGEVRVIRPGDRWEDGEQLSPPRMWRPRTTDGSDGD
jgi:hypothetical protein